MRIETQDGRESSAQLGPVGEKRANGFALRLLVAIPEICVCHGGGFEVSELLVIFALVCSVTVLELC